MARKWTNSLKMMVLVYVPQNRVTVPHGRSATPLHWVIEFPADIQTRTWMARAAGICGPQEWSNSSQWKITFAYWKPCETVSNCWIFHYITRGSDLSLGVEGWWAAKLVSVHQRRSCRLVGTIMCEPLRGWRPYVLILTIGNNDQLIVQIALVVIMSYTGWCIKLILLQNQLLFSSDRVLEYHPLPRCSSGAATRAILRSLATFWGHGCPPGVVLATMVSLYTTDINMVNNCFDMRELASMTQNYQL